MRSQSNCNVVDVELKPQTNCISALQLDVDYRAYPPEPPEAYLQGVALHYSALASIDHENLTMEPGECTRHTLKAP